MAHHLSHFTWPLVEESRVKLQQAIEKPSSLQHYAVETHYVKAVPEDERGNSGPFPLSTQGLESLRHVHFQRLCFSHSKRSGVKGVPNLNLTSPHKTPLKCNDVLLLTKVRPGPSHNFQDLFLPGACYMLAIYEGKKRNKKTGALETTARVYLPSHSQKSYALLDNKVQWFATVLDSLSTPLRIWEALHEPLREPPLGQARTTYRIMEEIVCCPAGANLQMQPDFPQEVPPSYVLGPFVLARATDFCDQSRLNASQQEAAVACLFNLLNSSSRRKVQLFQGPPGTGKTSTITVMLGLVCGYGFRVLACAPTNVAVSEIASRVLASVTDSERGREKAAQLKKSGSSSDGSYLQFAHHLMKNTSIINSDFRNFSLGGATCPSAGAAPFPALTIVQPQNRRTHRQLRSGDLALVGSHERLNLSGSLRQLHVGDCADDTPDRGKRVSEALKLSGWQSSAQQLLDFLGLPSLNEYDIIQQNDERVSQRTGGAGTKAAKGAGGLVGYERKQIAPLLERAMYHGETLCADVPSSLLPPREHGLVKEALAHIRGLQEVLAGNSLLGKKDFRRWLAAAAQDPASTHSGAAKSSKGVSLGQASAGTAQNGAKSAGGKAQEQGKQQKARQNEAAREKLGGHREGLRRCLRQRPGYDLKAAPKGELLRSMDCTRLRELLVADARLVLCTVASSGKGLVKGAGPYELVLVDEAAQLVEAEALVALQAPGVERAVLVGDPKQLPATVFSDESKACGYGRILFERLQSNGYPVHLLNVQYRMHPQVSRWPSRFFYEGAVQDSPCVCQPLHRLEFLEKLSNGKKAHVLGPYAFLDVPNGQECLEPRGGSSTGNFVEIMVIRRLQENLLQAVASNATTNKQLKVGIITPYTYQKKCLSHMIKKSGKLSCDSAQRVVEISVNSVDGFQGQERDVIVFSAVRANYSGITGFVKNERRLNVAITRGRHAVWIVGHAKTLQKKSLMWKGLFADAKDRACYCQA
eukprot:jgi/Mesen1/10577/ME000085S09909